MPSGRWLRALLIACWLPAAAAGEEAAARWIGPEGRPLPFTTDEEVEAFLRTAAIVSEKELTGGVNRPLKVRLRRDGVEANAVFRQVDVRRPRAKLDGKLILDFHDSYVYECAAWEVSRMLGIDHVPPCVERRVKLRDGTLQLWVEDAMTDIRRRKDGVKPPNQVAWIRQKQTMRLFDALIYNFDRNQGNMLIDPRWKLWFIDHTRSFRKSAVIENLDGIVWCERGVLERLQALDRRTLSQRLGGVDRQQVDNLLKRRDKLVRHVNGLVDRAGESGVLWDASTPAAASAEKFRGMMDDDIPQTSSKIEEP